MSVAGSEHMVDVWNERSFEIFTMKLMVKC